MGFSPAEELSFGHNGFGRPFWPQLGIRIIAQTQHLLWPSRQCFIGLWCDCRVASVIRACPYLIPKPVYLNWYVVCCPYFHRCPRCLPKSFIPAFPGRHKVLVVQNFLQWMEGKNASCPTLLLSTLSFLFLKERPKSMKAVKSLLLNNFLIYLCFRRGQSNLSPHLF